MKPEKPLVGLGVLSAFTASLCCITPVLAFAAGLGGVAAAFSWLDPARPYLAGVTVLALGFAWFQKLRPNKEIDCECETDAATFWQSKKFLGLVTVFAVVMLAFPRYAHVFYPKSTQQAKASLPEHGGLSAKQQADKELEAAEFIITGMTCAGCEEHIKHTLLQLEGVASAEASHEKGNAVVTFDDSKLNRKKIAAAIDATGYKVVGEL